MQYRVLCLAPTATRDGRNVCLFSAAAGSAVGISHAIRYVTEHRQQEHGSGPCTTVTVVFHPDDETCDHEPEEMPHV